MKGYTDHDDQFEQLLLPRNDTEIVIPVVLWAPAADDNTCNTSTTPSAVIGSCNDDRNVKTHPEAEISNTRKRQFVSVDELLDDLNAIKSAGDFIHSDDNDISVTTQKDRTIRIVMIAVEGTWNQAKRMVTKLPLQVRALHLSDIELYEWRTLMSTSLSGHASMERIQTSNTERVPIHGAVSILDPLRKQKTLNRSSNKKEVHREDMVVVNDSSNCNDAETTTASTKVINTNKVCTVEAVVSALIALSAIPIPDGDYIINLADQKVIRTVTYQGKMTLRNIISHW
jgi:hypothetical protein